MNWTQLPTEVKFDARLSETPSTGRSRSTTFCLYPLFRARYRYDGEARRHPGEECLVAVSARTDKIVMSKHASAVRAGLTKLRKLLSFDRRCAIERPVASRRLARAAPSAVFFDETIGGRTSSVWAITQIGRDRSCRSARAPLSAP